MISPDVASFIEGGNSIHVGSRNDRLEPSGCRAFAVIVDPDGTHLTVFLPQVAADDTLANFAANGQAAICVGRPSDDHACQVKGEFVEMRAVAPEERRVVDTQLEGLLRQLEMIGIPRVLVGGWNRGPYIAVRIRVTALFNQTPGPGAGAPIS
jgi:hypothetical protein